MFGPSVVVVDISIINQITGIKQAVVVVEMRVLNYMTVDNT